uniref:RING-type E3 ubiquitin transferase n=1 Tax=Glycine max TaxID=3847 RepID=C6T829_SOYBN|nr:unknown [Glycine max]
MLELSESHSKNLHFPLTHIILFFTCFKLSKAQSSMEPVPTYITHHSWEPSVAITVGAIIIALLLMGIISIYLRRCAESHIIITTTQTTTTLPCSCAQGINRELLNTFPTLFYSNIKDLKKGNETLECAVCLTDFTDKDALRLLPKCNHVFHPHCIDSWLACHVTCPVCRANLSQESSHVSITVPPHNEEEGSRNTTTNEATQIEQSTSNDVGQVCLGDPTPTSDAAKIMYISEEQQQQHSSSEPTFEVELDPNTNSTTTTISNNGGDGVVVVSERNLSRSNSTGHCIVEEQGKGVERYTLRLPEDVRRYILVNHGRSVQRSASVKGVCWSDSEESYKGKRVNGEVRVEKRWVICTPPFVGHG